MAALILLLFWAFMLSSLRNKSLTFDEGAYAAAGASYWRLGDYRLNPEAGALPQRVAGLPLALGPFKFPPPGTNHWRDSIAPSLGYDYFYSLGNDAGRMAARGRAACGAMAVLLGALVWAWSRRLFGAAGGMISLLLYVLSPTVLANGALMTSDMAAALFFAAATWAWWAVLHRVSPGRLLVGGLLTGGLFVSKLSAILIVPVVAVLLVARLLEGRPLSVAFGRRHWEIVPRARQALALALAGLAQVAVVVVVIWGFYGFRYSAFAHPAAQNHFQFSWEYVLKEAGPGVPPGPPAELPLRAVDFMRRHELLPEAWLYGLGIILNRTRFGVAFWNGSTSTTGWPGFFPYTFLVKTPLAVFAVLVLALAAGVASRRKVFHGTLPLWVFLAVYWLAAINSHLDIGHRYLLPVYAPVFILCGASAYWFGARSSGIASQSSAGVPARGLNDGRRDACATFPVASLLCTLLALHAAESLWRYPNYLAYFNGIVRPKEAYRHLVDSSLDWGQDLPAVKPYIDAHPGGGPFYLSYFGLASPGYYGVTARPLYSFGARYLDGFEDLRVVNVPESEVSEELPRLELAQPSYDLMGLGRGAGGAFAVLLKKPGELHLGAGTYLISATMLQSVCDWAVHGAWNERYEATYRQLEKEVQPLIDGDYEARRDELRQRDIAASQLRLYQFEQYRLARLAAYLRLRTPDDTLNDTILVYRLTDADLVRALE